MRITEISVKKLFGIFDHTIPLNLDDRITIIHSENGFGKTIILKMIYGLFNERYSEIYNIPFQEFQVRFDDDNVLWIDKEDYGSTQRQIDFLADEDVDEIERREEKHLPKITVNFSRTDASEPLSFSLSSSFDLRKLRIPLSFIDEEIPELERIGAREWIHRPTGETLSIDEAVRKFYPELSGRLLRSDLPEWWIKLRESVEIHLIQTQRLQSIKENDREPTSYRSGRATSMVPTVSEYAKELRGIIRQKLADSASLSQSLDSTFPTRLVRLMSDLNRHKLTNGELQDIWKELDERRSRLEEVGILDKEEKKEEKEAGEMPLHSEETGDTKDVLALYVQDVEKKLSVFDEIADKIGLFKEMIDKRFLYKSIVISKETGFTFVTHNGETLPLTALSSGEQHELVLLYQLLFKTKPNSLVLIDEPEISLHVAWLRVFLQDLQEITRLASFDVLIATHSPDIIQDRWDLTVRLEEPAVL